MYLVERRLVLIPRGNSRQVDLLKQILRDSLPPCERDGAGGEILCLCRKDHYPLPYFHSMIGFIEGFSEDYRLIPRGVPYGRGCDTFTLP